MIQRLFLIISLLCISTGVRSLGLGDIELNSGLNQPFNARIELLSPTAAEVDSLTVRLADAEAFDRAGIDRLFVLTSLRFEIEVNEVGPDYILITTREALREPYLNFLVEASWSSGRLYREYTVLLDPPLYDPNARRVTTPPSSESQGAQEITRQPVRTSTPATPVAPTRPSPSPLAPPSSTRTAPQPRSFTPSFTGDEYGPVASQTTLWSLASQIRPDASVTTQQMMLALLRANPEAFIDNNINGLREGAILRIPDRNEILSVSPEAAFAEAVSQNSMWEEMRRSFAGNAGQRPLGTESQPGSSATPTAVATSESELRLVSPGASSVEGQAGASFGSEGQSDADLVLANEQLEALASENDDLRGQIEESEELIGDLQRLIELKDDELASMQNQVAGADAQDGISGLDEGTVPEIDNTSGQIASATGDATTETPQLVDEPEPVSEPEPVLEVAPATTVPPAVTTVQTETGPAAEGMVDQILAVVFENITPIAGAVGALLVAFFGLFYIKKRKSAAESEFDEVAAEEFMELEESEDITDISDVLDESGLAEEEVDLSEEQTLDAIPESVPEAEDEIVTGLPEDDDMPASTAETSFLATTEAAEDEQDSDEDPLAEVNVFLAYEHFDQAEEFVRNAIKRSPDNLDFHSKLLEVFYSSGDKPKYEEEARILHDLTNGEGPHWEMAVIMWQEISPNRELFADAAGSEMEESTAGQSGIVDLTTADTGVADDEGLDFDLGDDESESMDKPQDVLDLTSTNTNIMDLTMDDENPLEDSKPKEDILDLTMAEGFESNEPTVSEADESVLDLSTGFDNSDDDILDITARPGVQPDLDDDNQQKSNIENEDVLDITSGSFGAESSPDDEVLDLTAGSFEAESSDDDDVLDITSANFGADLLSDDENALDIESDGLSIEDSSDGSEDASSSLESNVVDFDSSSTEPAAEENFDLSLDMDEGDSGSDLELSIEESDADDSGSSLELEVEGDSGSEESDDIAGLSLDDEGGDESGGLELDLDSAAGNDASEALSLEMDTDEGDSGVSFPEINMDDTLELPRKPSELDMESTVELPKEELSIEEVADDDDTTVIIPKSPGAGEQSDEDEVATKLDLAKAYVELGDNDSAETILDEILTEGNEAQKKQAQELKSQIS